MRAQAPIDLSSDIAPVGRRRASKEIVMRAALELIARDGSDRVSASDVVAAAGVSRSTLYAYFGDARGIFAEIWAVAGADWLRRLADAPLAMDPELSTFDAAMLDLLCVAARVPELREMVWPDVARLRADVGDDEVALVRLMWCLSVAIGVPLAVAVLPDSRPLSGLHGVIKSLPDDAAERLGVRGAPPLRVPEVSAVLPSAGELTVDRLMRASVTVVGDSGYQAASMMRVCRVARLTGGAAAPLFDSVIDLHDRAFGSMLEKVLEENTRQFGTFDDDMSVPDTFARFTRSQADPTRASWRRFRHELHVAARTTPVLADKLGRAFGRSDGTFAGQLGASGVDENMLTLLMLINHSLTLGMSYLIDLGFPVAEVEHRLVTRWLWQFVSADL